jgi:hypothetical protein
MRLWQFAIDVARVPNDAEQGWLFGRCSDLSVAASPRRQWTRVSVDRAAISLVDAVVSAIRDLDTVGLAPAVVLADDDLVTAATIIERCGFRPGQLPPWLPWAGHPHTSGLYRWSAVSAMLGDGSDGARAGDAGTESTLTAINLALRLRALAPRVERLRTIRSLIAG